MDKGFSHVWVVSFKDTKARDAYLVHPAHQAFVEILKPSLDEAIRRRFRAAEVTHRHRGDEPGREKAVAKILEGRSDANLSFDDLCFVLERAGSTQRSGKGSHAIFFKRWGHRDSELANPKAGAKRSPTK